MKVKALKAYRKLPSKRRVAAYARVSSAKDTMYHSLSYQISYYNALIQKRNDWLFCGVYADEALSGTKDTRKNFQRLLQDCRDHKIDLIITKSISRFARNTVTLLETVRELKDLGIEVYFEEQNIWSLSGDGELMLSILASYAQEEARSVSENMKWRIKKDFQEGLIWGGDHCYGYKVVNRRLVINPEEVELVKRIFEMYVSGIGDRAIATQFNKEGIPTHQGGPWKQETIRGILRNRNYTGDLILQKTYSSDYINKTNKYNRGEKDLYIVEDDHEPIISREMFAKAAEVRKNRVEKKHGGLRTKIKRPFDDLIVCGTCGKGYRFRTGPYRDSYICRNFADYGKSACQSKQIPDRVLKKVTAEVLSIPEFDESVLRANICKIVAKNGNLLEYHFINGDVKEIHWDDPKRSDGWTEEMKAAARLKAKERQERKKKECQK